MEHPDLVVVRTFLNHFEADVAKSALEAADIDALISTDDAGGMKPAMSLGSMVKILVRAEDAERASEILDAPPPPPDHDRP